MIGWYLAGLLLASPGEDPRAAEFRAYVNFDGAVLSGGGEDARQNQSEIAEMFDLTGDYPEYGGSDAQRSAVLNAVRADFAPYDIDVVDARPGDGEYTMVLVGPRDHGLGMGVYGIGPVDCFDQNHNNVAMVFLGADDLGGMTGVSFQATQVSQELAHAAGLEHVSGSGAELDIMFPGEVAPSASFTEECFDSAPPISCAAQHQDYSGDCPEADQQNSHWELLASFGPAASDSESPSVEITAPEDGEEFDPGESFDVIVEAADDVAVVEVELFADGSSAGTRVEAPYAWAVEDPESGEHELYALARDAAGNEAMSAVVTITVAEEAGEGEGDGGDPEGCQCGVRASPGGAWILVLVAFGGRRRR